jgi:hypothetical protein
MRSAVTSPVHVEPGLSAAAAGIHRYGNGLYHERNHVMRTKVLAVIVAMLLAGIGGCGPGGNIWKVDANPSADSASAGEAGR